MMDAKLNLALVDINRYRQRCRDLEGEIASLKAQLSDTHLNGAFLLAENMELKDQLASEKSSHAAWESEHLRQAAEMEAQLMECKKDAERYRFVSGDILSRYDKKDKSYSLDWDHRGKCSGESDEWPEIDDVIDAAISQKES